MSPESIITETSSSSIADLSDAELAVVDQLFMLSGETPVTVSINKHLYEKNPQMVTANTRDELAGIFCEMEPERRAVMTKRLAGMVLERLGATTPEA